jgi:hypothetical protein
MFVIQGFALSVSAAEHPARKTIDPQEAVKQFSFSYKRAAFVQARAPSLSAAQWALLCPQRVMQGHLCASDPEHAPSGRIWAANLAA